MPRKSLLRDRAKEWIERLPVGHEFDNEELYAYLESNYPDQCTAEGDASNEPRFHNTARWAIQWAKGGKGNREQGIVKDLARGRHRRVEPFR